MHSDFILTTQKDWVKLNSNIEWATDLLVIGIDICFQQPETFQSFLNEKLSARKKIEDER
jgi:tetraacyldisaccharide-1-P 4'-kinase